MSETDEKMNLPVTKLGICICEIFKLNIFSKHLRLKLYWLLQFGLDQKFHSSSSLGLEQILPKWNFIESSRLRFDLTFSMPDFDYSSNSGLEKKRPKWNLTES